MIISPNNVYITPTPANKPYSYGCAFTPVEGGWVRDLAAIGGNFDIYIASSKFTKCLT